MVAKTDYVTTDTYTLEQLNRYLLNVVNIIKELPPTVYKPLPETMRFLRASSANNIEEDLKQTAETLIIETNITETHIKKTATAFQYSGEIYAGGII